MHVIGVPSSVLSTLEAECWRTEFETGLDYIVRPCLKKTKDFSEPKALYL
jgi:hypothetical protein